MILILMGSTRIICGETPIEKQPVVTGILALVNDYIITRADVERLAQTQLSALRRQSLTLNEFERKYLSLVNDTVEILINRKLVLSEFDRLKKKSDGRLEFPEKLVDAEVDKIISQNFNNNRIDFIRSLTEQGMTLREFRREIREDLTVEMMMQQHISNEITVSPQKITDFYQSNLNQFTSSERIKLRMIMILKQAPDASSLISEVKNKLLDGASFREMAEVYSQGPNRSKGGDYGWIQRGSNRLRTDLEETAFQLPIGVPSGIIDSKEAYYILFIEDKEQSTIQPLADARTRIETQLLEEEKNRLRQVWIEKLKRNSYVERF